MLSRSTGAISRASIARSWTSVPKERCRPRSPAKVNVTHRTPGARSADVTEVGSHAKKKITSASNANTTTDRNALRVRSSIARSLRAMIQAAPKIPGGLAAMTHQLPIRGGVALRIEVSRAGAILEPCEGTVTHDRGVRRQRQPFSHVVGHDDQRGAARAH